MALTKCRGHEAAVTDVKFYPLVGKKRYPLFLSCGDYTVRMWHPLQASSKELVKLKPHSFGAEVCCYLCLLFNFGKNGIVKSGGIIYTKNLS